MNYDEIHSFLMIYEQETKQSKGYADARLAEIKAKGDYWQTTDELTHAARVAWRNSNKCIGRLFWQSLHVFDERKTLTHDTIFERLVHHINFATNGGKYVPRLRYSILNVYAFGMSNSYVMQVMTQPMVLSETRPL